MTPQPSLRSVAFILVMIGWNFQSETFDGHRIS